MPVLPARLIGPVPGGDLAAAGGAAGGCAGRGEGVAGGGGSEGGGGGGGVGGGGCRGGIGRERRGRRGREAGATRRVGGSRRGGIEVVGVGIDGGADGAAPGVAAESAAVLLLGELDTLDHDLAEVGEGAGGFGRDVAANGGGEEASEGGVEIAGGEVMAGEEMSDFAAEAVGGLGLVEFAGVERTEQRMAGLARGAAAAGLGERQRTQIRRTG